MSEEEQGLKGQRHGWETDRRTDSRTTQKTRGSPEWGPQDRQPASQACFSSQKRGQALYWGPHKTPICLPQPRSPHSGRLVGSESEGPAFIALLTTPSQPKRPPSAPLTP